MNLYLAPMEGITTHIYRNAFEKYFGGITQYYTPFLSNKKLSTKEIRDIHPQNNHVPRLIPQILTNQAQTFIDITNSLYEYGYKEVNLNLGCPSGTVVAKKRGAGFLSVPEQLDSFFDAIFPGCPCDISIKTRIGIENEWEWDEILSIYKKYPIKECIIHPRFQKEFYQGTPHINAYKKAKEYLSDTNISLCYNGDIHSFKAFEQLQKEIPDTVVMLGRGAIANPYLPKCIQQQTTSDLETYVDFSTLRLFHDEIQHGYQEYMSGEQPVLFKMKELWSYMGPAFSIPDKIQKKIRKANRLTDYQSIIQILFHELQESEC